MSKKNNRTPKLDSLSKEEMSDTQGVIEFGRGQINDNALKAMVTSRLFKSKVEKAKKGKGSFKRKAKHSGKEPYLKAA